MASLIPTSITLSDDSAIELILTDIPLFCEGIMGIGMFTFLVITKQVKFISLLLYGSSFLAFVGATLDLGQVIARGRVKVDKGIGLNTVSGFIFAREISLAFSLGFLNLFLWLLVATCPRGEQSRDRGRMSSHSASWNRWGLAGNILKWFSLASLLAVPLLQLLWRLIPTQRNYSSVYVAESTIQASVTAIFILKLFLSTYISPLSPWWRPFRQYLPPLISLAIGIGVNIGGLLIFSFSDSPLGRFLRAVEVYILMLHNLYNTFEEALSPHQVTNKEDGQPPCPEKAFYTISPPLELGISRTGGPKPRLILQSNGQYERRSSWKSPSPSSEAFVDIRKYSFVGRPEAANKMASASVKHPRETNEAPQNSQPPAAQDSESIVIDPDRPLTAPSLSYYTMGTASAAPAAKTIILESPIFQFATTRGDSEDQMKGQPGEPSIDLASSSASQQGSMTSIDELFRQKTELDKSIAALRLLSTQTEFTFLPKSPDPAVEFSRSMTGSHRTKTESFSGRSDFSLSIFPEPPPVEEDDAATIYQESSTTVAQLDRQLSPNMDALGSVLSENASPLASVYALKDRFGSAITQYDVTSFIGNLTEPSIDSIPASLSDDASSEVDEMRTITSSSLRPMILSAAMASGMFTTAPEPRSLETAVKEEEESNPLIPNTNASVVLRPFLLGNPAAVVPTQHIPMSSTLVPLAQRSKRRGSVDGKRRPLISIPQLNLDAADEVPGAYERPRAPPVAQ